MPPLPAFQLPLSSAGPPPGYGWEGREFSASSRTSAFNTGINARDMFLGLNRCVVCGEDSPRALEYCYISARSETGEDWASLMQLNWIPSQAKTLPHHEPRNGMLMCKNHHTLFDEYEFFIRFLPDESNGGKFVFVNFSGNPRLSRYHGKAIALDITHRYAPFPSLFIIHEFRVRGIHPFQPRDPVIPDDIVFQDWILWDGVVDDDSCTFNRRQ